LVAAAQGQAAAEDLVDGNAERSQAYQAHPMSGALLSR
jgi:hypothetical protein